MNITAVKQDIKRFVCDKLGVDISTLEYDTPLCADGIERDSIDLLEIDSYVADKYGVSMAGENKDAFYNIDAIAQYIADRK